MGCSNNGHERMNQFALVSYIPGMLGIFLDALRVELVPECRPHAHVTILPPRPVSVDPDVAIQELRSRIGDFEAFDVRLGEIEIFTKSDVIYLGVRDGERQLRAMYEALNRGALAFEEPFRYHPHITLAQNIQRQDVDRLFTLACRRWREYRGPRSFRVDTLTFVQNTSGNNWMDLAKIPLAVPVG